MSGISSSSIRSGANIARRWRRRQCFSLPLLILLICGGGEIGHWDFNRNHQHNYYYHYGVEAYYSVPTEIISVTTFNSSLNIDNNTAAQLGQSQQPNSGTDYNGQPINPTALTSLRILAYAGQNDPEAGGGLSFYSNPPPNGVTGVTTSASLQSSMCPTGQVCSAFVGSDGTMGPITVQIVTSEPVGEYTLTPLKYEVPFAYLEHAPKFLGCYDDEQSTRYTNLCTYGNGANTCYDTNYLLNPFCHATKNGIPPNTQTQCRGSNNAALTYTPSAFLPLAFNPVGGCFGCPLEIDRTFVDANGVDSGLYTTVPHFCPYPLSHSYPPITGHCGTTEKGDGSHYSDFSQHQMCTDASATEQLYYWCMANGVGYHSNIYGAKQTTPYQTSSSNTGDYFDMWEEWSSAYQCTLSGPDMSQAGACKPYQQLQNGIAADTTCYLDQYHNSNAKCNVSFATQVVAAVRFLTASCDAADTTEDQYGFSYADWSPEDVPGFQCPGSEYPFIRPAAQAKPFHVARCSASCQDDPVVVTGVATSNHQFSDPVGNFFDQTNGKHILTEMVLQDRAPIEMGPVTCDVFRITPRPIVTMSVKTVITTPDGKQYTGNMDTTGLDFTVIEIPGTANFSVRINRLTNTDGGIATGPDLDGYMIVCGTHEQCATSEECPYSGNPVFNLSLTTPIPLGQFNGVFPQSPNDLSDIDPRVNPWPNIIRRFQDDYSHTCTLSGVSTCRLPLNQCPAGATTCSATTNNQINAQSKGCAVPTPKFLSALNCGRKVFYYYVPQENIGSYGPSCGQMGFRNAAAGTQGGANIICQQGPFTCTPGFGNPRYATGSGGTAVKSPCQELGDLTNFNQETVVAGSCSAQQAQLPQNLPPGWAYSGESQADMQYDIPGSAPIQNGIPNSWLHDRSFYRELSSSEAATVTLDLEIITNAYFGGQFASFAPGKISNITTFFCDATVDISQSGSFVVSFCNDNPSTYGSYTGVSSCYAPGAISTDSGQYSPTPPPSSTGNASGAPQYAIIMDGSPAVPFGLGPNQCTAITWSFSVTGPYTVGQVTCDTYLYPGAAEGLSIILDQATFNCNVSLPQFVSTGVNNFFADYQAGQCSSFSFFCQLSQQSRWYQYVVYIFIFFFYIVLMVVSFLMVFFVYKVFSTDKAAASLIAEQIEASHLKRQKQTREVQDVIDRVIQNNLQELREEGELSYRARRAQDISEGFTSSVPAFGGPI